MLGYAGSGFAKTGQVSIASFDEIDMANMDVLGGKRSIA